MGVSAVWRGVFCFLASVWALLMLVVGLLAVSQWADRLPGSPRVFIAIGIVLIAMGQFVAAVVADRVFPGASRRVSGSVQVAAWGTILLAVTLGVAL